MLSASSDPSAFFKEQCPHLQFPSPPSSGPSWDQPGGAPGQDLGHSRGHLWPCSLWWTWHLPGPQELRVLGAPQRIRASPSGHSRTRTGPPVTKCLGQRHREPRYSSCAQGACRLVRKTRTKRADPGELVRCGLSSGPRSPHHHGHLVQWRLQGRSCNPTLGPRFQMRAGCCETPRKRSWSLSWGAARWKQGKGTPPKERVAGLPAGLQVAWWNPSTELGPEGAALTREQRAWTPALGRGSGRGRRQGT